MRFILVIGILIAAVSARADVIVSQTFSREVAIPDGNPVGILSAGVFSMGLPGQTVGSITVSLNLSGGYNGDLYACLVSPNGTLVTLMDEPGVAINDFGAFGSGMNITLSDASGNPIQEETGGAFLAGMYQPAGTLGDFNDTSADGTWDIYFADMASGGGTETLNSFTLDIDVVPERVTPALVTFFVLLIYLAHFRGKAQSAGTWLARFCWSTVGRTQTAKTARRM